MHEATLYYEEAGADFFFCLCHKEHIVQNLLYICFENQASSICMHCIARYLIRADDIISKIVLCMSSRVKRKDCGIMDHPITSFQHAPRLRVVNLKLIYPSASPPSAGEATQTSVNFNPNSPLGRHASIDPQRSQVFRLFCSKQMVRTQRRFVHPASSVCRLR